MKYVAVIVFKHLPHWQKKQIIDAKTKKKAEDIIRRMYKDSILKLSIDD